VVEEMRRRSRRGEEESPWAGLGILGSLGFASPTPKSLNFVSAELTELIHEIVVNFANSVRSIGVFMRPGDHAPQDTARLGIKLRCEGSEVCGGV
jgi:hypothetical protein